MIKETEWHLLSNWAPGFTNETRLLEFVTQRDSLRNQVANTGEVKEEHLWKLRHLIQNFGGNPDKIVQEKTA